MDKHYFLRAGIHFDPSVNHSPMNNWQSLASPPDQSFSNWDKSTEKLQYSHFDSVLGSMVSSPAPANFPAVAADPGFAERAAKFSCFGSRSFNGRNSEAQFRSAIPLHRVSSNPSMRLPVSPIEINRLPLPLPISNANSNDDSSVSEQNPSGQNDTNSRKRKPNSRKAKEETVNAPKKAEEEDSKAKRSKLTEKNVKAEEEQKQGNNNNNDSPKPAEPPKDYIHVRARRGQATDSHSLAERVRREKISERMKLLQDLVPGCNKVTGKALMLDEIINYVQSLQCQVEFLSMKLASVNPRVDVNMDNIISKDLYQPNPPVPNHNQAINSSVSAMFGHQNQQMHNNSVSPNAPVDQLGLQLPQIDVFGEHLAQFSTFCEDDLQSIVQMGFGDNNNSDLPFQLQTFDSQMKLEL